MEIGRFKPLLIGAIQTKYDEATVSGDARRAPALKELLDKLEETSGTDSSFALAWGEYTALMIRDLDIYRSAQVLIREHGEDAVL